MTLASGFAVLELVATPRRPVSLCVGCCRLVAGCCRLFGACWLEGVVLSVTLSGRNPATLARERGCSRWCPESEGLHGSRIMAVTAGGRPAWPRWWPAGLAWVLWALVMLGLPVVVWLQQLARQAGRSDLVGSDADTIIYGLVAVSAATVGAVLASRRPATRWAGCCWPLGCGSPMGMGAGCCWPGVGHRPPSAPRSRTSPSW